MEPQREAVKTGQKIQESFWKEKKHKHCNKRFSARESSKIKLRKSPRKTRSSKEMGHKAKLKIRG